MVAGLGFHAVSDVPVDRRLEALAEVRRRLEPERRGRPARVDAAAGLAVRLRRVPPDLAVEPGELDDQLDERLDGHLAVGAQVHRLGSLVPLGGEHDAFGGVVDVQELPAGRARAPDLDAVGAAVAGVDALLDQGRDHVRHRRVELVARPIEVRRHQVDAVLAELGAVRLQLHQLGQLGDAVRGVRLLGVALPERVLRERHRRELRVRADRPDDDGLRRVSKARFLDHVRAHQKVVEVELGGTGLVGTDAADMGREMDHQLGFGVGEHRRHGAAVAQVVVAAARRHRPWSRCGRRDG